MVHEQRRLLQGTVPNPARAVSYGAVSDVESEASTASVSDETAKVKVFKPFKDIAPICLGLWTS
jgi:hypothetical protein